MARLRVSVRRCVCPADYTYVVYVNIRMPVSLPVSPRLSCVNSYFFSVSLGYLLVCMSSLAYLCECVLSISICSLVCLFVCLIVYVFVSS